MADIVSEAVRSRLMSGVRSKDTKPEMMVRRGLHALGFRFRLHVKALPGSPDLVLPKYGAVIFVHGCFWHGHDCRLGAIPTTRRDFWLSKFRDNADRDRRAREQLIKRGWRVLEIWECAIRGVGENQLDRVLSQASQFLKGHDPFGLIRS